MKTPEYYDQGGIECIDVIRAWNLNFELGNVLKYICRAGKKDSDSEEKDLRKAKHYLELAIERLKPRIDVRSMWSSHDGSVATVIGTVYIDSKPTLVRFVVENSQEEHSMPSDIFRERFPVYVGEGDE